MFKLFKRKRQLKKLNKLLDSLERDVDTLEEHVSFLKAELEKVKGYDPEYASELKELIRKRELVIEAVRKSISTSIALRDGTR